MGAGPLQITLSSGASSGSSGTVTSIASGGGIVVSPSPITSTGTVYESHTINAQTGTTYTILTGDHGKLITFSNGSAIAVTLPQSTGSAYPAGNFGSGFCFYCQNLGAGTVTITPTTSTIDGAASLTIPTGQGCMIVADGTNYNTMRGRPTNVDIASQVSGLGSGVAAMLGTFSSANIRTACTDESGTGALLFQSGALGTPTSGTLTNCTGLPEAGVSASNNNRIIVTSGGTLAEAAALTNGQLLIGSTGAAPVAATVTAGTGISVTNGAGSITIAASGVGAITPARVSSQFDKTNATLAGITGLSWTLSGSTSYNYHIVLILSCSAAGGAKVDLNGGTATATAINTTALRTDGSAYGTTNTTSLSGTLVNGAAAFISLIIDGTITVNAGGTFIPQFAQNTASGTSSVLVGSYGWVVQVT